MKNMYCPECGNIITVDKHIYLSICPSCKQCVKPIKILSSTEALEDVEPFFNDEELRQINKRLFKLNKEIDQKEMENK
jgi:NAD-dependent SIR2 family protein deacetylase